MSSVFLHSPLNINLSLVEMVKAAAREIGVKYDTVIDVKTATCYQRENGLLTIDYSKMEDMTITYGSDFSMTNRDEAGSLLCSCPERFPLRDELSLRGFSDPKGHFHPIFLIPLLIIFNRQMISKEQAPESWKDLLDERWRGKILFPERHLPACRAILALMRYQFPDRFDKFLENIVFKGSPVDVKNAVDEGQYPLGINKVSFARYARHKNVTMVWPKEGAFCLPNTMVFKKNANKTLFELGEYLRSLPVQDFFLRQGYIPVSEGLPLLSEAAKNDCRVIWKGWDWFFEIAKAANSEVTEI